MGFNAVASHKLQNYSYSLSNVFPKKKHQQKPLGGQRIIGSS